MEKSELESFAVNLKTVENELGTFSLGKVLGHGGTSVVREATLGGLSNKKFAIKFLLKDVSKRQGKDYLRFKQAYVNLSSIQHLGCSIPLLLLSRHESEDVVLPYVVMGRADSDLKRELKGKTVSIEQFERIFLRLLNLISIIHKHGIVHRDLKPENVFVIGGRLFLGDFDISKFDDSENLVLVDTKPGDRLANYLFSAPEQSNPKIGDVCNASDWYAFAQIMIWIVKGQTVRGLTQIRLKDIDLKYAKFDELFSQLLQQNPKDRLQTGDEIQEFLRRHDEDIQRNEARTKAIKSLRLFDDIVRKYSCKVACSQEAVVPIVDRSAINDVLCYFRDNIQELSLYVVYDGKDFSIDSLSQIGDQVWTFGIDEICVDALFIYKHFASGGNIVVVRGADMPAEFDVGTTRDYEEFARFKGTNVSRAEYDAGWAVINGQNVRLNGEAKLVARQLSATLYFIAPAVSPLCERKTFELVSQIGVSFHANKIIDEHWLETAMCGKIRRASAIRLYD